MKRDREFEEKGERQREREEVVILVVLSMA